MMNVNSARQSAQNARLARRDDRLAISSRVPELWSRASKLPQEPPATIDYGQANRQANQDCDRTSEKEFPYHNRRALT
jgi:hypothetical protein